MYHVQNVVYNFLAWSDSIDGGGWKLVRRVKKGSAWHPTTDQLNGVVEYGTPGTQTSDETFSIRFDTTTFNQFLFATGTTIYIQKLSLVVSAYVTI